MRWRCFIDLPRFRLTKPESVTVAAITSYITFASVPLPSSDHRVKLDDASPRARCSPAGVYFASRDMVARTDPITLNFTGLPPAKACPGRPVAGMVASTRRFWKDAAVCQYPNGSLWKVGGQTAAVGAGCHAVEWLDPHTLATFLWCRDNATKRECVPVLPPRPKPTPPTPAPPPPFGPLYDPLPQTGVIYSTTDPALQGIVAHAAEMASRNIKVFRRLSDTRNLSVMEEGAQFRAAWLEVRCPHILSLLFER